MENFQLVLWIWGGLGVVAFFQSLSVSRELHEIKSALKSAGILLEKSSRSGPAKSERKEK